MSGNSQQWNYDAPGGIAESTAQVAAGIAEATAALSASQAQAHTFWTSFGDSVSAGHPETNAAPVAADRG